MRRAVFAFVLASSALADNSVPSPPPAGWQDRCSAALDKARRELGEKIRPFQVAPIRVEENAVLFDALIPDAEHARFFSGKPAHFFVHVKAQKSKEPGEIGGSVGKAGDTQASAGFKRWTRRRFAELSVEIAEGRKVFLFQQGFTPAVDECLR